MTHHPGTEETSPALRRYFTISLTIFALSMLAGYFAEDIVGLRLLNLLRGSLPGELEPLSLFGFISLNNTVKGFLAVVLGVLFGIYPGIFLLVNGVVIGAIVRAVQTQVGIEVALVGILPHGIPEIGAILFSTAIGFRLGHLFLKRNRPDVEIKSELKESVVYWVQWAVPVLLLAAVIEVWVTAPLLSLVG